MKDWLVVDPQVGLERWTQRGRFTGLGQGNIAQDNAAGGFDGWIFVEHYTHLQDPIRFKLELDYEADDARIKFVIPWTIS